MLCILMVEDSPADAQMMQTAIERTGEAAEIIWMNSGAKAVAQLTANKVPAVDVVLLDLNLPGVSGFEVLETIRATDYLKGLPVVVMSGSRDPGDIERCYRAGANSYITKSAHLDEILETTHQFVTYWSKVVQLPRRPANRCADAAYSTQTAPSFK